MAVVGETSFTVVEVHLREGDVSILKIIAAISNQLSEKRHSYSLSVAPETFFDSDYTLSHVFSLSFF